MNKGWFFTLLTCFLFPLGVYGQSLQLADSLLQKGKQYDSRGQYKQAEFYYGEAYHLFRDYNVTPSWLEAGKEYASAMAYRSKYKQAMELYRILLEVENPANDAYNRGDIYNSMGLTSKKEGKPNQALAYYQKALPLALKSNDAELIGVIYDNIGVLYLKMGNYVQALKYSQKALPHFTKLDKPRILATAYNNIGLIYDELSLYDKALTSYKRSLDISKAQDDVHSLSVIHNNLGSIQSSLGNYDQALVAFQKSLDYAYQAGIPSDIAKRLNNIGLLYDKLGQNNMGKDYFRKSLALKKETSSSQSIAVTTANLGSLLWNDGKRKEASVLYDNAFELRKEVGNPYELALSLQNMIKLSLDQQNIEQARGYTRQLKTIGDTTGSYDILEDAWAYFGDISAAEGNPQKALQHYQKSYAASQLLPTHRQIGPLKRLARQYHSLGSDSAVVYGQQAVELIEQSRTKAGATSQLKTGYFQKHSDFYTRLASWLLEYRQDPRQAFRLAEQAKARSFSDDLAQAAQNIDQKLPEKVRIERKEKRNHIDSLYSRMEGGITTEQQRSRTRQQIRNAELEYAAYENRLQEQYPILKKAVAPKAITLERAQTLVDDETAVLEYAVAGNQLLIFLITADEVHVEQFSAPDGRPLNEELTARVTSFREAIISNASRNRLKTTSNRLYQPLLKPFEQVLSNYRNLIIVPDGALAYLPFEALSQGDRYLIENFRIKYEPSLTSLTLLDKARPANNKELLAVAGSQFASEGERPLSGKQLAGLPSTGVEVDSIASHFNSVSLLKDREVTEEAFKTLLQQNRYRYVHLATHGIINENKPGRSGLALSTGGELTATSKEDGMLRSSEVFGLDITSDMVVLSACNTGLGKVVDGEGMLGLQRSFFYAGTSTVIVSLWNVYDRSTATFMNEYYKALLNGESEEDWVDASLRWIGWDESLPFGQKATAMRQAKLKMLNHPLFHHPVYWAPFIVVGR